MGSCAGASRREAGTHGQCATGLVDTALLPRPLLSRSEDPRGDKRKGADVPHPRTRGRPGVPRPPGPAIASVYNVSCSAIAIQLGGGCEVKLCNRIYSSQSSD